MKKIIAILFFTGLSLSVNGQEWNGKPFRMEQENKSLHCFMTADTMTLDEVCKFFEFTDMILPKSDQIYDRYLYINGQVYYRPGLAFFREPHIYVKQENGHYKKLANKKIRP